LTEKTGFSVKHYLRKRIKGGCHGDTLFDRVDNTPLSSGVATGSQYIGAFFWKGEISIAHQLSVCVLLGLLA
jgi:hypothetical protein